MSDDVRRIWLNNGMCAVVDEDDWYRLQEYKNLWQAQQNQGGVWYATRKVTDPQSGERFKQYLHRVVMNAPPGVLVDHIDGDGLNCRKINLRCTTTHHNTHNYAHPTGNPFRGITRRRGKWIAQITENRRKVFIGSYTLPQDAARAYDREARRIYGEHARLNFPEKVNVPTA